MAERTASAFLAKNLWRRIRFSPTRASSTRADWAPPGPSRSCHRSFVHLARGRLPEVELALNLRFQVAPPAAVQGNITMRSFSTAFTRPRGSREFRPRQPRQCRLSLESLERRTLLTMTPSSDPMSVVSIPGPVAYEAGQSPENGQVLDPDGKPINSDDAAGEGTKSGTPQSVSGAYLTGGAEADPGYDKTMSFDKVIQGQSDTCTIASTISAVALSSFDLNSGITIAS